MSVAIIDKPPHFFLAAAPLFLVLFIDSMGLGLVFPILNTLVLDPHAHFVASTMNASTRNFLYGLTISLYMFCWFFGAAFLGDISDQIGRKKSLIICLLGACLGYLFSALAVFLSSYFLLVLGRVIAGFTAGSQAIAQAAIVDLSSKQHKARNLGLILFFTSLGFVVGPMIGGLLSDSTILPWFNYALPFYFAAVISVVNAFLLSATFKESMLQTRTLQLKWYYALEIFISAFKSEKIRDLSIVLLVLMFGWSGIYSFVAMYFLRIYQFSALKNGFLMGMMGLGFGLGSGFLMDPLLRYFSLRHCVIGGALAGAASIMLILHVPSASYLWFAMILIGVTISIAYSALLTLFSNQADESAQGWIMGITGAVMAFAFAVNSFLTGLLANLSPQTPLFWAAFSLALTAFLMKSLLPAATLRD